MASHGFSHLNVVQSLRLGVVVSTSDSFSIQESPVIATIILLNYPWTLGLQDFILLDWA